MFTKLSGRFKKGLSPSTKLLIVIIPSMIICYLYAYRPLRGLAYAFMEYKPGRSIMECEFVGLKYFRNLLMNPVQRREVWRVLRNTIAMSMIGVITSFLPAFVTVLLNEIKANSYKRLVQTIITIPNFVSWVIVYSAFYNILAPSSGLIARLLNQVGLLEGSFDLMTSADKGWLFMWLLGTWKGVGWGTVIYFAALSSIDTELYDAAAVDGAGRFHKMRYITIPCLMPTYVTLLVMSIGSFLSSDFDRALNFTNAFNRATVETLDLYVYETGLVGFDVSRGTAIGLFKSVVGIILMVFSNQLSKKVRGYTIF